MRQAQPTVRISPLRDQGSKGLDPAELCATLRELASQVHRIVSATHGLSFGADVSEEELAEVHARIVRLQTNLGVERRDKLGRYVSALRKRFEEYLAGAVGIGRTVLSGGLIDEICGSPWYSMKCSSLSEHSEGVLGLGLTLST